MKTIIAAMLLALVRSSMSAWSQGAPAGPDIQQDKMEIQQTNADLQKDNQDVRGDLKEMQTLDARHADAVKDINAKEKAAMDAVKDDKSLTPAQRKEKLAAIRAEFKALRKTLNGTFRADKRNIQRDMKKDRADVRKDERGLRGEQRDLHQDARHERHEGRESGGRK